MPGTVIAERVGWRGSSSWFRENVARLRPEYAHKDPADRLDYTPGDQIRYDLWFPPARIPLTKRTSGSPPVLVMVASWYRHISTRMLPSRTTVDSLLGMWHLLASASALSPRGCSGTTRRASGGANAWASALYDEVRRLGYPLSYPRFVRQVRNADAVSMAVDRLPYLPLTGPNDVPRAVPLKAQVANFSRLADAVITPEVDPVRASGTNSGPVAVVCNDAGAPASPDHMHRAKSTSRGPLLGSVPCPVRIAPKASPKTQIPTASTMEATRNERGWKSKATAIPMASITSAISMVDHGPVPRSVAAAPLRSELTNPGSPEPACAIKDESAPLA